MIDLKLVDFNSLEVDGINTKDYPDFVDAYISYGQDINGNELSENDLDALTYEGYAHELVMKKLF